MATVAPPTGTEIVGLTGLNTYIEGTTEAEFQAWLETLVPEAENVIAVAVGEALYDGDGWTRRKAGLLKQALAYEVAAMALVSPELQKVTGTQEPLLMEDASEIAEAAARLRQRGTRLMNLATADIEESPFALPVCSASTFNVSDSDRTPSDRNRLQDERDDVSAEDTDRG